MGKRGRPPLNLTGQKFGKWTVLSLSHSTDYGDRYWWCQCKCGSTPRLVGQNYLVNHANQRRAGCNECGHIKHRVPSARVKTAKRLRANGMSLRQIGERLGVSYERVRMYLLMETSNA